MVYGDSYPDIREVVSQIGDDYLDHLRQLEERFVAIFNDARPSDGRETIRSLHDPLKDYNEGLLERMGKFLSASRKTGPGDAERAALLLKQFEDFQRLEQTLLRAFLNRKPDRGESYLKYVRTQKNAKAREGLELDLLNKQLANDAAGAAEVQAKIDALPSEYAPPPLDEDAIVFTLPPVRPEGAPAPEAAPAAPAPQATPAPSVPSESAPAVPTLPTTAAPEVTPPPPTTAAPQATPPTRTEVPEDVRQEIPISLPPTARGEGRTRAAPPDWRSGEVVGVGGGRVGRDAEPGGVGGGDAVQPFEGPGFVTARGEHTRTVDPASLAADAAQLLDELSDRLYPLPWYSLAHAGVNGLSPPFVGAHPLL